MAGRIYLLNGDSELVAMEEAPYDSERLLQQLLAEHPDLLAGEQINSEEPRRWLLVTREMSVPCEEDGAAQWSLDHLFLDQDAVPTLVEVKRSSDTRIRRAVVGQMLDYAANAVAYWPIEEIKARFETRCEMDGEEPDEVLTSFLEDDQVVPDFWKRVKTNLQAGRIRMIFLADSIPAELRRIVEFLNEQMDPAEVLAIEIRQFLGEGMQTLVPRVLGQTEAARQKKSPTARSGNAWDEESFMTALRDEHGETAQIVARDLLAWIRPQVTELWWGSGAKHGGVVPVIVQGNLRHQICRMSTQGRFVFCFDWLARKPPFHDESLRKTLLAKINEIPGVRFGDEMLTKRLRIALEMLVDPIAKDKLKAVVSWLIDRINEERPLPTRHEPAASAPSSAAPTEN